MSMLSHPAPDESPEARALRGELFNELDRLAFALEMEACELVEAGREEEAETRQKLRLGVRLAQRLVTGIWADEVNRRIERYAAEHSARMGGGD